LKNVVGVTVTAPAALLTNVFVCPTSVPSASVAVDVVPKLNIDIVRAKLIAWALALTVSDLYVTPVCISTRPVPVPDNPKLTLVSVPTAATWGTPVVAALLIWISFTAEAVGASFIISALLTSLIAVVILGITMLGDVNVLFVNVWVWALNVNSSFVVSNGNVIVLSAANSLTPTKYWWSADVSLIWGKVKTGS